MIAVGAWVALVAVAVAWGEHVVAVGDRLRIHAPPLAGDYRTRVPARSCSCPIAVAGLVIGYGPRLSRALRWEPMIGLGDGQRPSFGRSRSGSTTGGAASPIRSLAGPVPAHGAARSANPCTFLSSFTDRARRPTTSTRKGHPPGMVLVLWVLDRLGLGGTGSNLALVLAGGAASVAAALVARAGRRGRGRGARSGAVPRARARRDLVELGRRVLRRRLRLGRHTRHPGDRKGGATRRSARARRRPAVRRHRDAVVRARPARGRPGRGRGGATPSGAHSRSPRWVPRSCSSRSLPRASGGSPGSRPPVRSTGPGSRAAARTGTSCSATSPRSRSRSARQPPPGSPACATGGVWLLVGGALVVVALADLSGMSKAEVERIWLPFVPWVLLATAPLAATRIRSGALRTWLCAQAAVAIAVQAAVRSPW